MDTKNSNWQVTYQYALGAIIVIGFMALFFLNLLRPPDAANTVLSIMLGILGTMTSGVVNYFFGSSKGSADKTSMIYNSTPAGVVNPVAIPPVPLPEGKIVTSPPKVSETIDPPISSVNTPPTPV